MIFGPGGADNNDIKSPAAVRNCSFTGSPGNYHIGFLTTDGVQIAGNTFAGSPGTADIEIPGGVADTTIEPTDRPTIDDSGTRTRIRGTVELGGAPTGSNYSAADAGLEILDTSTSPVDRYAVLQDGSVAGPL